MPLQVARNKINTNVALTELLAEVAGKLVNNQSLQWLFDSASASAKNNPWQLFPSMAWLMGGFPGYFAGQRVTYVVASTASQSGPSVAIDKPNIRTIPIQSPLCWRSTLAKSSVIVRDSALESGTPWLETVSTLAGATLVFAPSASRVKNGF